MTNQCIADPVCSWLVLWFIILFPIPDRPDPPRNLRAMEVYSDYIVIAWDEPETDGGCPITEYKVEKCDAEKQAFFSAGKHSFFKPTTKNAKT